jgi:hypothetical protein
MFTCVQTAQSGGPPAQLHGMALLPLPLPLPPPLLLPLPLLLLPLPLPLPVVASSPSSPASTGPPFDEPELVDEPEVLEDPAAPDEPELVDDPVLPPEPEPLVEPELPVDDPPLLVEPPVPLDVAPDPLLPPELDAPPLPPSTCHGLSAPSEHADDAPRIRQAGVATRSQRRYMRVLRPNGAEAVAAVVAGGSARARNRRVRTHLTASVATTTELDDRRGMLDAYSGRIADAFEAHG